MIGLKNIINESIIRSNNAGNPAYRFSLYNENGVVSILVSCKNASDMPKWDEAKVKKAYRELDEVFKKDIRYAFNRYSVSKDKILTYIWCILSACKNYQEVKDTCEGFLVNKEDYKEINVGGIGSSTNTPTSNIRIQFVKPKGACKVSFHIHTTIEYSNYKYVK